MAEAVGLTLGVLGVAALFSTCVEAFDVVVSAKECSKEYEELSALLGLQRLRFEIWGESVGLPSGRFPNEPKIPYNTQLDLPQVQPDIKRALENIQQLLSSVTEIDGRYGATTISASSEETTTLRGTHIFQKSFDRLKKRIRKGQKDKSILKVTRWALHDAADFKETILRLTTFVDGLYQVTTSLGLLQQRYEDLRIHEEINAITDEGDLELLAEATSKHSSSSIHRTVSDAASKRLSVVTGSMRDGDVDSETRSEPQSNASTYSFHTAKTGPSQRALEAVEEEESEGSNERDTSPKAPSTPPHPILPSLLSTRSCAECEEASLHCSVDEDSISCVNCLVSEKECSFDLGGSFSSSRAGSSTLISTPQHERLLAESVARSRAPPKRLSFEAGDVHHGERMKEINDGNLDYWDDHSISFVHQANRSNSARKRMFHELKTIHKAGVPFISATPVGDNLGRILASIEGPPETPYEGGIFWILVSASQATPPGAPNIRFHTKVYHPNIDHRTGILCADFEQKWGPANVPASLRGHFAESIALWSERTSPDMWSLLALLIAICGLLASPNAADPLVPDIAQKYIEDPDGYYEAAKKWTEQYAKASEKPNEDTLRFPGEPSDAIDSKTADHNDQGPDLEEIVDSLLLCDAEQSHLRQFTGDSLSKIEQWRMVREMRLALDRELHRTAPSATWELISSLGFWTDSRIRTLIRESANRQSNKATSEMQLRYLITLKSSFGCTDKFESPPEKNHEDRSPHQVILAVESNGKYSGKSDQATAVAPALVGSTVFPSPTTAAPAPSPGDTGPSTIASSVPEGSSNSPNGNLSKDSTPSKAFVDTSRPEPWPPYQPYCTTDTSGITTYASPRVFTPRYTSNGYYATRSSPRRKQTRSTSHNEAKRRSSYAYRTPYVKSDEKEYEYVDYMVGGVFYRVPAHRPRKSTYNYRGHGTDRHYYSQQPRTERPTTSAKKTPPTPKATEADAWRNRIPPGYSLKNWDPTEEPIMLFGSVFDANSLGKWIYDWTVYHHGSATPLADLAGELWHLLIQLAGKIKRAEECMPRIREVEDREMAEEFIESGERLMGKLKKILKACETPILKAGKKHNKEGAHLGKNAGTEFVDSIFGRDRQLESTEKFMSSIRLWSLRFDANCEDILRNYASRNKALVPLHSHGKTIQTNTEVAILLMKPVAIRTTFGLEDIAEEPASLKDEWFSFSTSKKDKKKKAKVAVREKTKAGKTLPDTVIDDVDFGFGISRKDKKAKHNAVNGEDMPKHSGTDLKVGFEDDLNWGGWWSIPTKGKGKVADAEDLSKESHLTSKPAERDRADWGAWGASTKITEAQGEDSSLNVEDLSNKSDLLTNHDVGWAAWSFAPRKGKDLNVEGTPRENDSTPKLDDDVDRVDWGFGAKIEKKEGGPAPGRQDLSEDMKGIKADLKVIA